MRAGRRVLILGVAVFALTGTGHTTETKTQRFNNFDFLKKGTIDGVAVSEEGVLRVGPTTEILWQADIPFVWDVAVAGKELYFAAGASGAVYRRAPDGTVTQLFSSEEVIVTAVAAGPSGRVAFGTSPEAKVYQLSRGDSATLLVDLPDTYVWDLQFDERGSLWIATGQKARVYRLSPGVGLDTVLTSEENHLRCLVPGPERSWLIGSADHGYVYRLNRDGRAFVVWDAPLEEVTNVAPTPDGKLLVVALGKVAPTAETKQSETSSAASRILSTLQKAAKQKSQVFLVDPDGVSHKLWDSSDEQVFSAIAVGDGVFWIGTGPEGRIYSLDTRGRKTLLATLSGSQVLRLARWGDSIVAATANPGRVTTLTQKAAARGTYTSPSFDAKLTSHWGELQWQQEGHGTVRFYTRSGNTKEPNDTWSPWSGPLQAKGDLHVKSPAARFLQWKVEIDGKSDLSVREIALSYQQRNAAPVLKRIRIYPPNVLYADAARAGKYKRGGPGQGLTSRKSLGDRKTQAGFRTCSWDFQDPNGDKLVFTLEVKRRDWSTWRVLGEEMAESAFALDTRTLPDGYYRFRVTASDYPSNPKNQALTARIESEEFLVDHGSPTIRQLRLKRGSADWELSFQAADALSRLREVSISVGSGPWEPVAPEDGLVDSKNESFRIPLPELAPGTVVSVRVADEFGNRAYSWVEAK